MKGICESVTDAFSLRLSQKDWIVTVFQKVEFDRPGERSPE